MSSIDKEIARDITVAWLNTGKLSEEYLSKKQVAAFYECIFQSVSECKIQSKGVSIETASGTTITATPQSGIRRSMGIPDAASSSTASKHRFT
ncbi:MAG: hypothetical protein ABRQ39_28755 [Candidatus Eremiobacterota bacterium]